MELDKKLINFIRSKTSNVDECLIYLLACRHGLEVRCSEEAFQTLVSNKLIKLDLVSNKIIPLIGIYEGELVNVPEIDISIEQEVRDRIDEYRSLFKGVRTGSIGIKSKVSDLLVQFCLKNNKTIDEVILVTKVYMDYTDFKLISNADNFISKLDKDGNEISLLAMAFEEQSFESTSDARTYKVI